MLEETSVEPTLVTDLNDSLVENQDFDDLGDLSQFDLGAATVSSEWSTGTADARNGVYWFWDPMWDYSYDGNPTW